MSRADLLNDLLRDLNMLAAVGVGTVHHLHEQVGLRHFLQRRLERLDKGSRELVNEADRIRQQEFLPPGDAYAPYRRIECGKEHVRFKYLTLFPALRQSPAHRISFLHFGRVLREHRVHDRGFPRICVPDERDERQSGSLPLFPLCRALAADAPEFPRELAEPVADGAAVDLQLRLAFSLGGHGAGSAALAVLGLPHADQAWLQIAELGELHLQPRFPGPGSPLKDLEDQRRPVHYRQAEQFLEIADLGGRQRVIKDDPLRAEHLRDDLDLLPFSRSHIQARADMRERLRHGIYRLHPAGLREFGEFRQGVHKLFFRDRDLCVRLANAHKDHRFSSVPVVAVPYFICSEKSCHYSIFPSSSDRSVPRSSAAVSCP